MTAHSDFEALALSLLPAAYFDFAGAGATGLIDRSGNGHTLTATGAPTHDLVVPNLDGFRYASLNGTSQHYTPASGGVLNFSTFTFVSICAATKPDAYLWDSESNASVNGTGWGAIIANAANGSGYGARLGQNPGSVATLDANPFGTYGNQFIMVAVTYDGTMQTLWMNGVPIKASLNQSYAPGSVVPLIGKFASGSTWFKGGVSDTMIFGGVLTTQQLLQLGQAAQLGTPASGAQVLSAISSVNSIVTAISTALNRISPPNLALLSITSTTYVTGVGTLSLASARGMIVRDSVIPPGWGIDYGVVGRYENRMVQLELVGTLSGGVTSVPIDLVDQHDAFAVYLFDNNLPTSLNYDVAPGATVRIDLLA